MAREKNIGKGNAKGCLSDTDFFASYMGIEMMNPMKSFKVKKKNFHKAWLAFLLAAVLVLVNTGCASTQADPYIAENNESGTVLTTQSGSELSESELPESEWSYSITDSAESSFSEEISEATDIGSRIPEDGEYYSKDEVALYLHLYHHLPDNYITKSEARELGWEGGPLEPYAPGKAIGGDIFGNYEGLLPEDHTYHECDIDTKGKSRGAKRLVWSEDWAIYYTEDHYDSFTQLYPETP